MKKIKNKLLIGLFCMLATGMLTKANAQAPPPNYDDDIYWHYRYRLTHYFMSVGPAQGQSLPAGIRNQYNGDVIAWGDTPTYLGYYLGVLGTEYRLLKNQIALGGPNYNSAALDQTLTELSYAIKALYRIDSQADTYYGLVANVNGFIMNDDVPVNFITLHPELNQVHGVAMTQTGTVTGTGTPGIVNNVSSNLTAFPGNLHNGFSSSQDDLIELLMGLGLVKKCMDAGTLSFNNTVTGVPDSYDFLGKTQIESDNLVKYMQLNPFNANGLHWLLAYPDNGATIPNGGDATAFSYGISRMGQFISNNSSAYIDPLTVANDVTFQSFKNNIFRVPPQNGKAIPQILLPLTMAAVGDCWHNLSGNDTPQNIENQGNYPAGCVTNTSSCWVANQYGMNTFYGCVNRYLHDKSIYDVPAIDACSFYTTLSVAPYEGPFNHGGGDIPLQSGYNFDWASSWRHYANPPEESVGSDISGNYNGLDYMLMYNLMYLMQANQMNTVSGTYPASGNIGSQTNPLTGYYNLTPVFLNNLLVNNANPTGNVTVVGGVQGIHMLPSVIAHQGSNFHAYIDYTCSLMPENYIFRPGDYKRPDINPAATSETNPSADGSIAKTYSDAVNHYPNPITSQVTFEFSVETASKCTLEIFDISGKKIKTLFQNISFEQGSYSVPFELSDLTNGVYIYTLTRGDKQVTKKLVKQNN